MLETRNGTERDLLLRLAEAVAVYRDLLQLQSAAYDALNDLTPARRLAKTCPACFGPPPLILSHRFSPSEPDYIAAHDDGNLQHKRLQRGAEEDNFELPPIFVDRAALRAAEAQMDSTKGAKQPDAASVRLRLCESG